MSIINLFHLNNKPAKYNIFYNGKKYKNFSQITLQENSCFILKEKNIFSNKFLFIICWFVLIIFFLILLFSYYSRDFKFFKISNEIRVNYGKIFQNEIIIFIADNEVKVSGLELYSIIFNGTKL